MNIKLLMEPKEKVKVSKYITAKKTIFRWIDSVYEIFQNEDPKESNEEMNDNISYEDSQIRLIILESILAILFSILATSYVILFVGKNSPILQTVFLPYNPDFKQISRTPHLALIYSTGTLNIYEFNATNYLIPKSNFTLQKVKNDMGYFAYQDHSLHIICPDMRKVHSVINRNQHKFVAYKDSEDIKTSLVMSGHVRVGDYLWIFGGRVSNRL